MTTPETMFEKHIKFHFDAIFKVAPKEKIQPLKNMLLTIYAQGLFDGYAAHFSPEWMAKVEQYFEKTGIGEQITDFLDKFEETK